MVNRKLDPTYFLHPTEMKLAGLTSENIEAACNYTHGILDLLDEKLLSADASRLSEMIELANLSSVVGNLLGAGIAKSSNGLFERNQPHKYPDILSKSPLAKDFEIKVALGRNNPKGHLAKQGFYLICRYILAQETGLFDRTIKGKIAWIWEIRFGYLELYHFNLSNTVGDSGKTAVINKQGMEALKLVYCDINRCPYPPKGRIYKSYSSPFDNA